MSGGVDISFTSDEQDLYKAQAKLIKQQEDMINKYKNLGKEAKGGAKDATREMERFAAATTKINRTPAERYNDTLDKLNAALKAGKINQETYNRAVAQAKGAQGGAFGAAALANLGSYAAGILGVGAALRGVIALWKEVREASDQAGKRQLEDVPGLAELSQLAETPAQLQELMDEAKKTFAEGGAATLGAAGELQFALTSAGLGDYREAVSALQAAGVVRDAKGMVDAAAAMEAALGRDETGSFRDIVSKAFGASKGAPARAEALLQAAASSGSQARALGITDEELLAGVATTAKVEGGAAPAATQIEALLKGIEEYGIGEGFLQEGRSLREWVQDIQKLETEGEDLREILGGRQEAITGYRNIKNNLSAFDQNMREVVEAERTDAFGRKIDIARGDPRVGTALELKKSAAADTLDRERDALLENLADSLQIQTTTTARGRLGAMGGAASNQFANFERFTFGNEAFLRDYGSAASPSLRSQIEAAGVRLGSASESLDRAATRLEGAATGQDMTNAARANQAAVGGAVEAR